MLDLMGLEWSSSSDWPIPFLPAAIATASLTFCCDELVVPPVRRASDAGVTVGAVAFLPCRRQQSPFTR